MRSSGRLKLWLLILIGLGALVAAGTLGWALQPADGSPVVINGTEVPPLPRLDSERVAQGEQLYRQYCAGCHGANLEGAPDWRKRLADGSLPPPPHDSSGHTWHHPDELLARIILEGGEKLYGGTMPAFGNRLTREQANMILEYFKSRWGKDEREYQWWMTMIGAQ
jgi:mono/diheme cytochrome c family protein